MKKINFKQILTVVLWIIGLSSVLVSLAFVTKKEKLTVVENMSVSVLNTDDNLFIDESDVKEFFNDRKDSILNTQLKNININDLEKAINSHPAVQNADVAVDVNGDVTVSVIQRTPLVRVINLDGESYYIDDQSKLMPLNDNYTARVLVATGFIKEPFAQRYQFSANTIAKHKLFSQVSVLDDIYAMADYINKDTILTNLIHQINITNENEIEIFPSIGNQKIIFGDAQNINEKFNKLKLFYTDGLNKTDGWQKYSIINLKYKNQVVCTKK